MSLSARLTRTWHTLKAELRTRWFTPSQSHRYDPLHHPRTRSIPRKCIILVLKAMIGVLMGMILLWIIVFRSEPGWKAPPQNTNVPIRPSPIFITAASSNHYNSLQYMLYSMRELGANVIFYDLELTQQQKKDLITWDGLLVKTFDFQKYPKHVDIKVNAGEYAWKAIMITQVLEEYKTDVIWIDAGAYLLDLDTIARRLSAVDRGLYVGKSNSPGTVRDYTHPGMLTYFNTTMERWGSYPNVEASLIGIRYNSPCIEEVIKPWYQCAMVKECIAPTGSSRRNHRQDQSALGYLMHRSGYHAIQDRNRDGDKIAGKCDRSFYQYLFGRHVSISQYRWLCLT